MNGIRIAMIASVVGGVALDLVRQGSTEYSLRAEIERVEHEIEVLSHHRADVRVGTQQRILSRVRPRERSLEAIHVHDIVQLEVHREPTPWERSEARAVEGNQAFATDALPEALPSLPLVDWLRAR